MDLLWIFTIIEITKTVTVNPLFSVNQKYKITVIIAGVNGS